MKAEGMLQGRLGVREWLNVAQGGARPIPKPETLNPEP